MEDTLYMWGITDREMHMSVALWYRTHTKHIAHTVIYNTYHGKGIDHALNWPLQVYTLSCMKLFGRQSGRTATWPESLEVILNDNLVNFPIGLKMKLEPPHREKSGDGQKVSAIRRDLSSGDKIIILRRFSDSGACAETNFLLVQRMPYQSLFIGSHDEYVLRFTCQQCHRE